jgi:serine phosphatase RsbU (regulator of sigma subunit)/pSer/pThr/pTyr-binding forkhead associated (FHA) protein
MTLYLSGTVDDQRRTWALDQPLMGIGRSSRNTIHLPDPSVSREHAQVMLTDGKCELHDLGSRNGVRVNGRRIEAPTILATGDRVEIGAFALQVSEGEPTTTIQLSDQTVMDTSVRLRADQLIERRANQAVSGGRAPVIQWLAQAGQMLVIPRPLHETCDELLEVVARAVPASRYVLLLQDKPDAEPIPIASRVAGGRPDRPLVLSRTILHHVINTCAAVMTREPSMDPRFQGHQSVISSAARSAMAVPLFDNQKVLGVLYVDTLDPRVVFDENQLEVLTLLGNMAAVKITNARLLEHEQVRARMAQELSSATRIQRGLLPTVLPTVPGWLLDAHLETCYEVGGDLYDVRVRSDGRLSFMIGDVSGKGMGASLLMSSFLSSLRVLDDAGAEAAPLANRLGSVMARNLEGGMFVTAALGSLDPATGVARVVNAGHMPTYVVREGGIASYDSSGIPFGILPEFKYHEDEIVLAPGETLVMFTDGVTEAQRGDEFFDEERLQQVLIENAGAPSCREMREAVMQKVDAFLAGAQRTDDITLLMLRRNAIA